MKTFIVNQVKPGFYLDSVALMRFSRTIAGMDGVKEAALMMGTPSNKKIMAAADILAPEGENASGGDLIIGIRADNQTAAERALSESKNLLEQSTLPAREGKTYQPRTLSSALKLMPGANLALISVSGEFAAAEARKALHRGLHVMIFSDNVPVEEEIALKNEGRQLGLLVMGPDCGTAIINGIPLAFANKVKRGDIGIIGASGTGIQEVSSLISQGGGGISQAIGVGGRDLKEKVGGLSTLMALDVLDADPNTRHIRFDLQTAGSVSCRKHPDPNQSKQEKVYHLFPRGIRFEVARQRGFCSDPESSRGIRPWRRVDLRQIAGGGRDRRLTAKREKHRMGVFFRRDPLCRSSIHF